MQKDVKFQLATLAASLLAIGVVHLAYGATTLPGAAIPSQVEQSLRAQEPAAPQRPQVPIEAPKEAEKQPENEKALKIKFVLNELIIEGNKAIPTKELKPIYEKSLHKEITVADLFKLVQGITNYYRNKGYIISRALLPPQHVQGGQVKVQVIEGYIGKVMVSGEPKGAKCLVYKFGDNIKKCPPLQIKDMEENLNLANEIPGASVKAVLSPSKDKTGAADLILNANLKRLSGYFSYDNYGTRYIGPQQMTANLTLNSAITSGDSTSFTFTKTPKGTQLTYWDLNYTGAVSSRGSRARIGTTKTVTHPQFVLKPSDINGTNNNYYAGLIFPMIRERARTWTITLNFNYLDSDVFTFDTKLYIDHIRSLDLGTTYNFADRYLGSNLLAANLRQGLPILGYSSDIDPDTATTSRPGGRADYTKINLMASRLQAIKGPWSAYSLLRGQWAANPLLSSEQFSFGGNPLGRGYDVAEIIGDLGVSGSLELRYDWNVAKFMVNNLQFYTFYDFGAIWNRKALPGTLAKISATSTGLGVRFSMTKYVSGNFMWTQTLTKPVAAEELLNEGRRPRLWFSVVASF